MPIAPDGTPLPYPEEMAPAQGAPPPGMLDALLGGGGLPPDPMAEEPLPEEEEEPMPEDPLEVLRGMLDMASAYQSMEQDDEDLLIIEKVRTQLQQLLAKQQKEQDSALGVSPQMKALRRASR